MAMSEESKAKMATTTTNNSDNPAASLDVLRLVQAARQTYGLRTGDYVRYHRHCVRRIRALHKSTKTTNKISNSKQSTSKKKKESKPAAFSSTSGKITAESAKSDARLLELLLWEAERAWAEGMRTREDLAVLERVQQQASSSQSSSALAAKRHRSSKRFARAVQHSQKLLEIVQHLFQSAAAISASTYLQAEIYHSYIAGTHAFTLASSASSAKSTKSEGASPAHTGASRLSTAYVLLETLASAAHRASDEALAFEFLDELEPMIRYCAYKADIGQDGSSPRTVADTARLIGTPLVEKLTGTADSALDKAIEQYKHEEKRATTGKAGGSKGASGEAIKEINWRDLHVPIRSAELSDALGKVQSALAKLATAVQPSKSKTSGKGKKAAATQVSTPDSATESISAASAKAMQAYDKALAALGDAEERARKLVDDNATALLKAHSARFEAASAPLAKAHSYIVFQLLTLRVARDEALFETTIARLRAREEKQLANSRAGPLPTLVKKRRARTYPMLIKLLDSVLQSLEQLRDLDIVEQDSMDLPNQVDTKLAYNKARRCAYLGSTYGLLEKFPEALTLLQRSHLYIRQARSSLFPTDTEGLTDTDLSTITLTLDESSLSRLETLVQAFEKRATIDWFLQQHTASQKDSADINQDVASLSLDKPKPRKKAGPTLFDVAYNYVAGIDLDRLDQAAQGIAVPSKRSQEAQATIDMQVDEDPEPASIPQTVNAAVEKVAAAIVPEVPASPSKNTSGGGIWGFFGRKK